MNTEDLSTQVLCLLRGIDCSILAAHIVDDRYLNQHDSEFVDLVIADLIYFLPQATIDRVLIFPPVQNRYRFLIHKTVEGFTQLHSFSVGEGFHRRTVVCKKDSLKRGVRGQELLMYGHQEQSARGKGRGRARDTPLSPSLRPGSMEPQQKQQRTSVGNVAEDKQKRSPRLTGKGSDHPCKTKRPEQQFYIPRALRNKTSKIQEPDLCSKKTDQHKGRKKMCRKTENSDQQKEDNGGDQQKENNGGGQQKENNGGGQQKENNGGDQQKENNGGDQQKEDNGGGQQKENNRTRRARPGRRPEQQLYVPRALRNKETAECAAEERPTLTSDKTRQQASNVDRQPPRDADRHSACDVGRHVATDEDQQAVADINTQAASVEEKQPAMEVHIQPADDEASQPSCDVDRQQSAIADGRPTTDVDRLQSDDAVSWPATDVDSQPASDDERKPSIGVSSQSACDVDSQPLSDEERRAASEEEKWPASEEEKWPASDEEEKRPASDEEEKWPASGEEEKPPASDEEEKRPASGEEEKPPASDEEEKSPASDEEEKPPAGGEEEKRPASGQEEKRPASDEEEKRSASVEEKRPASVEEEKRPASDEEERRPASDEEEKPPASDEEEKRPASDEEEKPPANDEEEKRPASDEEEKRPASDEKRQPTSETDSSKSVHCETTVVRTEPAGKMGITHTELPDSKSARGRLGSEEEEDDDSWDKMFDENGDLVDTSMMEELTSFVGKVDIKEPQETINYLSYSPKETNLEMSEYGHVIEISDFPVAFQTADLMSAFKEYMNRGFDIKWVDDTHALGVFSSTIAANDALKMIHPMMKLKPMSEASKQSRLKAKRCEEFLQPFKPRPKTSAAAARRLVTGALGLGPPRVPKEQRDAERKVLKEAREKKRNDRKRRDDIWNGNIGTCAMDSC